MNIVQSRNYFGDWTCRWDNNRFSIVRQPVGNLTELRGNVYDVHDQIDKWVNHINLAKYIFKIDSSSTLIKYMLIQHVGNDVVTFDLYTRNLMVIEYNKTMSRDEFDVLVKQDIREPFVRQDLRETFEGTLNNLKIFE